MRKLWKLTTIGVLSLSMGVAVLPSTGLTANAKTRSAKVISTKSITKSTYHINAGYLYSSAKLTKKTHKGQNYLKTTFYATKSATVKKTNGKKAVYYYIANSKGSVKGWAWRGNLSKINLKALNQRKSDIKKVLAAVRTMTPDDQDNVLSDFTDIDTKNTYDRLSSAAYDFSFRHTTQDAKALSSFYQVFAGRFNAVTNARLATLNDRLVEGIRTDDLYDPFYNMSQALSDALSSFN